MGTTKKMCCHKDTYLAVRRRCEIEDGCGFVASLGLEAALFVLANAS
jgi:hypothetical protein